MKPILTILFILFALATLAQKPNKARFDTASNVTIEYKGKAGPRASAAPFWLLESTEEVPGVIKNVSEKTIISKARGVYAHEYKIVDSTRKNRTDTAMIKRRTYLIKVIVDSAGVKLDKSNVFIPN